MNTYKVARLNGKWTLYENEVIVCQEPEWLPEDMVLPELSFEENEEKLSKGFSEILIACSNRCIEENKNYNDLYGNL